jgi:hypothetical protein
VTLQTTRISVMWLVVAGIAVATGAAEIATDRIDPSQIYFGEPSAFEKPAGVDLGKILRATPEYDEIKKKKIERGTGRYWILYGQATDRANQAIVGLAHETEYDLVASLEYLSELEIVCEDITELVVTRVSED